MNKNLYIILLSVLLLVVLAGVPSLADNSIVMATPAVTRPPANFSAAGPMFAGMTDGSSWIESMYQKAVDLKEYSCQFSITVFKKGSTVKEAGAFYFKQPRQMRSEENGEYHRGAVVVFRKDGTVRVHLGGALKFFTVTLQADDSRLLASNGYPMRESDFVSLVDFLKNWLVIGIKSRVTESPVTVEGVAKPVCVLEMYKPGDPHFVLKRVYLDPVSRLPVRWDDHDYAYPSLSRWKDVKANPGLPDSLFDL